MGCSASTAATSPAPKLALAVTRAKDLAGDGQASPTSIALPLSSSASRERKVPAAAAPGSAPEATLTGDAGRCRTPLQACAARSTPTLGVVLKSVGAVPVKLTPVQLTVQVLVQEPAARQDAGRTLAGESLSPPGVVPYSPVTATTPKLGATAKGISFLDPDQDLIDLEDDFCEATADRALATEIEALMVDMETELFRDTRAITWSVLEKKRTSSYVKRIDGLSKDDELLMQEILQDLS